MRKLRNVKIFQNSYIWRILEKNLENKLFQQFWKVYFVYKIWEVFKVIKLYKNSKKTSESYVKILKHMKSFYQGYTFSSFVLPKLNRFTLFIPNFQSIRSLSVCEMINLNAMSPACVMSRFPIKKSDIERRTLFEIFKWRARRAAMTASRSRNERNGGSGTANVTSSMAAAARVVCVRNGARHSRRPLQ